MGHWKIIAGTALISLIAASCLHAAAGSGDKPLTIGGVVYTDLQDPMQSGLAGVTVTIQGDKGAFIATTGGSLGLWKVDVPQGTYTVTPQKKDYVMQHLIGGWCDGESSTRIAVKPANLAAIQSIQFLAIDWPEQTADSQQAIVASEPASVAPKSGPQLQQAAPIPEPEQPQATAPSKTGRTGGGCATTRERNGKAIDFFTPYVAGVSILLVQSRRDRYRRPPCPR